MKFGLPVNMIINEAAQILGFLMREIRYFRSPRTLRTLYLVFMYRWITNIFARKAETAQHKFSRVVVSRLNIRVNLYIH